VPIRRAAQNLKWMIIENRAKKNTKFTVLRGLAPSRIIYR
jgi:hypothetical protein